MKVFVQSVNFNIDKDCSFFYRKRRYSNLEKFNESIINAEVFFKVQKTSEKENKITEIKINIPGNDLVAKKQNKTFEEGVTLCVESLKKQLLKKKEKQSF
ncbi:MAG: HPF/RaiA family ribosome-associated protein [Flavobacteriaceae bacterium]|nr:HPF/RaiA family ribosome-associated protein [Flavobacteriaceae bacterium]